MKDIQSIVYDFEGIFEGVTIIWFNTKTNEDNVTAVTMPQLAEFADTKGYLEQLDDDRDETGEHRQTLTKVPVEYWIDNNFGFKEAEELLTYLGL